MLRKRSHKVIQGIIGIGCITSSSPAISAKFTVHRNDSKLVIEAPQGWQGDWELVDTSGHVCLRGDNAFKGTMKSNRIEVGKLASDTDVVFRTSKGSLNIPAQRKLSPYSKLNLAARIYQLPIRTYSARGLGREGRGTFDAVTGKVLNDIKDLGIDYVWFTGVLEHATRDRVDPDVVKGDAGSYYAIYDAWDVSPDLGSLADFEALIERAHAAGLRVMIDLVPNHTARVHKTDIVCKDHLNFGNGDDTSEFFAVHNNYYYIQGSTFVPPAQESEGADGVFDSNLEMEGLQLETPAKVTGNDIINPTPDLNDWFETVKLNYGVDIRTGQHSGTSELPRTWSQVFDVAQYWLNKGVDGFRVDFAHVVPLDFWHWFISELRQVNPEVYLVAEAYESSRKSTSFRYKQLFDAGFDSIYHSYLYWRMHDLAKNPGQMRTAAPSQAPLMRPDHVKDGDLFTHYMENHDELRLASRQFTPSLASREKRAELGLAYTAYLGLMPGNLLIHGGQEFQEDASVFGPFAGNNGRTSIFDWVYQPFTRSWQQDHRPDWLVHFRTKYQLMLNLKSQSPFNLKHSTEFPTFFDLDKANWYKDQSKWIGAYIRVDAQTKVAYLIVTNSDPRSSHSATIHFTSEDGRDELGVLSTIGIIPSEDRWTFTEEFSRPGLTPTDPNIEGYGVPGNVLFRSGGIPSGLFLGDVPAATTYIFRIHKT